MASINSAVFLEYKGLRYRSLVTFGVIEQIEQEFNLVLFDLEIASSIADCEKVAVLFSCLLNSAGANTSTDDVGEYMFSGENSEDKKQATLTLVRAILRLIFPERKAKKLEKPTDTQPLTTYQWKEFYKRLVGIEGIQPSDFWTMTPAEAFLIVDLKEPEEKIGSFSVDEFESLERQYYELNNG